MMSFCTDSALLKALRSLGYARFSRLDSVQKSYHTVGSPISVNYLSAVGRLIIRSLLLQYPLDKRPYRQPLYHDGEGDNHIGDG